MKVLHKIATGLGLTSHTLEDIIEKAQKTDEEVIITATVERDSALNPVEYQPTVIIGKKYIGIGKPVHVNFSPIENSLEKGYLKYKIIEGRQTEVEKILYGLTEKLNTLGINARCIGFNRSY